MSMANPISRRFCIGDIHGHFSKLQSLWANLEATVGAANFTTALFVILGDFCDSGPQTREVLDFLTSLYPNQSHVFLCGNHDLAFRALVGALPLPPDGSPFAATWPEFEHSKDREGWFEGEGFESMHVQGRRWGGLIQDKWNHKKNMPYKGSIYDAGPTFESYSVPRGSSDLIKAVPDHHKMFLTNLAWVHEEDGVWIDHLERRIRCKLIAVHGGFEKSKNIDEQLSFLKARDTSIPKVENLSGRQKCMGHT